MASWFATSAEEIRRQLEQLAGESGGKFTSEDVGLGALFEHGQAVLRASADRAAEQVQQSVQRLASEADEGLQTVGATFAASVNAWSGQRAAEDLQSSDLINLYKSEVETFSSSYVQGDANDEASKSAAIAAQTLSLWNQRLQGDADADGNCLAAPGLRGLLETDGLQTVLRALTRGGRRRRPLLARAAAVAAECAAGAAPRSPSGKVTRKASEDGKALDAKLSDAQTEAAVGEQLARLVLKVAAAPEALVAQLLALLAEAAEAADRCEGGELSEEKNPAEEDVCWVVNLLLATLTERREADALASHRVGAALKEALDTFSQVESDGKRLQHPPAVCKAAPFAGGGRPDVGSDVWACYPMDGHWYRAQVRGFAPRDRVRVAWCSRPEHDDSLEYVQMRETETDGELFTELSSYSVMRVDASIRRPPPSPLDQVMSEALCNQSLQIVEHHSQLFRRLRHVGKQLDVHLEWGSATSGGASATADCEAVWRYVPEDGNHIDIRSVPSISGNRTHERLVAGEVFRVSETFEGSDGTLYLKLADGRGWVFDSKAGIGTLCVRCQSDSEEESQSDGLGPTEQPLSGTAETLSAWRVEIEERAEYLGTFASECEEEVQTFEGQISSSTAAMKVELEALQAERASVARRADGLRMQREELLAQLLAVEEELKGVESADAELDSRESQLKSSMGRVSKALSTQREASQENGLVAACRHRVLLGTVAASRQVEELVAQRAAAAAAAADSTHPGKKLSAHQKKVRSATLESDKTRYRELQDLISSWQDQIWGPGSGALVSNTAAAAALQAAHLQAVSLVEDAQKEADEIAAAECGNLGLEGLWGLASPFAKSSIRRQMSRSAAGYKVMREQLCENLERLGELQCAATVRTRCGSLTSASTGHHGFGFSEGSGSDSSRESQDVARPNTGRKAERKSEDGI